MLIPFERHVRLGSDVSFLDWSPLIIGLAQTAGRIETLSQLMYFPAVSGMYCDLGGRSFNAERNRKTSLLLFLG